MKTLRPSDGLWRALCLAAALALAVACGKKPTAGDSAFAKRGGDAPVPVETNSFKQVSTFLDPGGSLYLYLGTEQFLQALSSRLLDWKQMVLAIPDMKSKDRENVGRLFDVLSSLVKASGLEELSAVGASGMEVEKGVYLNKFILHHYPGRDTGFLWSMFGKTPHQFGALDYLPETTAMASVSDLDIPLAWKTIKQTLRESGIPELATGFDRWQLETEGRMGLSLDKVLNSLGGDLTFVVTLDSSRTVALPQPSGSKIDIPEPALALMVKVKEDVLFEHLDRVMQNNRGLVKVDKDGLRMRTLKIPAPLPVRPTVARAGEYLFLSTSDQLVSQMVAVHAGQAKGLKDSQEFQAKTKGLRLEGNSFSYVSPEIGRTINHVIDSIADLQAASGRPDNKLELLQKLLGGDKEHFSVSVAANTPEGWVVQGRSSTHPAAAFVGQTVAPAAIAAGMVMPAMARAKERAQSINCVNNLKQVGLAARLHANDHGDVMPKDFESMKAYLGSPRILVCPKDPKAGATGTSWADFKFGEVSYEIVSPGVNDSDPLKIYARCPFHGHVCRADGSVQQPGARGDRSRPRPR